MLTSTLAVISCGSGSRGGKGSLTVLWWTGLGSSAISHQRWIALVPITTVKNRSSDFRRTLRWGFHSWPYPMTPPSGVRVQVFCQRVIPKGEVLKCGGWDVDVEGCGPYFYYVALYRYPNRVSSKSCFQVKYPTWSSDISEWITPKTAFNKTISRFNKFLHPRGPNINQQKW